ncbi:hypothetical protein [Isoptericola sp. NPDC057191]|uniref:hypothetical protein n=1 Tax=Isoptericola sp. NPDC057191 TaxID=3346041 RepID=UPI00363EBD6A
MSDDVVEFKFRMRRRNVRITAGAIALLIVLVAWWVVSGTASVVTGSTTSAGAGHGDQCLWGDDHFWAVYAKDEAPVAVQTVRNESRWPVEVISTRPDAYRFEPSALALDESIPDPKAGPPPESETSDRVTIPAGREAVMWIINPFRAEGSTEADPPIGDGARVGVSDAPLRVRSLGLVHNAVVPFYATLWKSGLPSDSPEFQARLAELCET